MNKTYLSLAEYIVRTQQVYDKVFALAKEKKLDGVISDIKGLDNILSILMMEVAENEEQH